MSFLGCVNKPDTEGSACDFNPEGVNLLPNTFGSYFFPAIENERQQIKINYQVLDTLLCFTEPFTVSPGLNSNSYTFKWNDGTTGASHEIRKEGVYWVHSIGNCYEPQQVDTFIVRFEPPEKCHCEVFIPTAFTPNNDGRNDEFRPIIPITCLGVGYRLLIYNRWGNLVFQSYDILNGWDGMYNNTPADIGVYYYQLVYKDEQQREHSYKGDVTLLR